MRKNFVDSEKTSQSQKGVRNMGTLRYMLEEKPPAPKREHQTPQNKTFLRFYSFLLALFAHLDPDPGGPDPDLQHC